MALRGLLRCLLPPSTRQDSKLGTPLEHAACSSNDSRQQDAVTAASASSPPQRHAEACDAEVKRGGISLGVAVAHPVPERSRAATPPPGGLPFGHERQDPMQSQPTCQPAASDAGPLDVESEECPAGLHARSVQRSSASSSSSSSSNGDASMCQDMMCKSPYFMTALSLDSRKIYQSPRSVSYYGNLRAQAAAMDEEGRAGLAMSVLQRLFAREGECALEEMLEAVLDGEAEGHSGKDSWCKVIRVPFSCHQEATPARKAASTGVSTRRASVTFAPGSSGGLESGGEEWSGAPETQTTARGESAEDTWHMNVPPGRGSRALIQVAQVDDSTFGCSSVHMPSQGGPPAPPATNACDVSVGVRNAPQRVKSLVDLNLASKSNGSGRSKSLRSMAKHASINTSRSLLLVDEDKVHTELGGAPISAATLPLPRVPFSVSFRKSRWRSEALFDSNGDPTEFSAPEDERPAAAAAAVASPSSKARLLTILNTCTQDSHQSNAVFEHHSRALAGLLEEPDLGRTTYMTTMDSQRPSPMPNIVPLGADQASELMGVIAGRDEMLDSAPDVKEPLEPPCWHEVFVTRMRKASGRELLMVYQTDVTMRTQLETTMAQLTELQLNTLCQIFPRHVIEFLSTGGNMALPQNLGHLARSHADVSVLFMDICGFTSMSKQVAPDAVMTFLNSLFSSFDELCEAHRCHKVETAGDCYIVSSGLLSVDAEGFAQVAQDHDPAESTANLFSFAKDMLAASREVLMPHDSSPVQIRIGIHTGPCVSGVVGSKLPKFAVFGDTMNTASRMESTCTPGRIQVSSMTHSLLMDSGRSATHDWEATGGVAVKGKGVMETYLWREPSVLAMSGPVPSTVCNAEFAELLHSSGMGQRISAPAEAPHSAPHARNDAAGPSGRAAQGTGRQGPVVPLPAGMRAAAFRDISRSLPSYSQTAYHLPANMRSNLLRGHKSQGSHLSPFNAMTQIIFQLARDSRDGDLRNMLLLDSDSFDTSHSLIGELHSDGRRRLHRGHTRLSNYSNSRH